MTFVKNDPNINRKGRKKGSISLTSAIKKKLVLMLPGEKKTYIEKIVDILLEKSLQGDVNVLKTIWGYLDGLPKQSLELGMDELIGEVNITIKKNEEDKPKTEKISQDK